MHYSNLVIIEKPDDGDIEAAVKEAMGAHEDQGGFWDWYQIGGRWTGVLSGYDPEKDEANIEECWLCNGTGVRTDAVGVANGMPERQYCNGCDGKGKKAKWPTSWAKHEGDIATIESVSEEAYKRFFRVVTGRGRVFGGEYYAPWKPLDEMFPKQEMPPLDWLKKEYAGHLVVVVDNHV